MKRLSVIIPMYNVEPYVERCLRSLEIQDINKEDFEIICVNDGSPDNSKGVVSRLQQEFDNIILIDQENQGVSRARNNGIEKATGRYILFIDPDDYIASNTFSRILIAAEEKKANVSFLGFTFLYENGQVRKNVFHKEYSGKVFSGIETYFLSRKDGSTDPDRMWAILFESEFLKRNELRYLPDVPFLEDGELIVRILCLAERCIFDGRSFYQRTTRPGSATNSNLFHSERAINGFLLAATNLKKFQQQQNLNDKQRNFINQPLCKFVLLVLNSGLQKPYLKNYRSIRKKLRNNNFNSIELKGVVRPYIYYANIYNYLPIVFLLTAYLKEIKRLLKK